jgi:hypothetical protein
MSENEPQSNDVLSPLPLILERVGETVCSSGRQNVKTKPFFLGAGTGDKARGHLALLLACCAIGLNIGCNANPKAAAGKPPVGKPQVADSAIVANDDPSAIKMHDIEGAILMYYAINKVLPPKIEDALPLADVPLDMNVPGTSQQYVYTREGIILQDQEARLIVYEPAPLHKGHRLAIRVNDPKAFQPLVMHIIPVPESFFLLHPPEKPDDRAPAARFPQPDPLPSPEGAVRKSAQPDIRR